VRKVGYAIELKNLTKKFGQFTANDNITFQVKEGEIYALCGENGAGKTTLMNMIYGLYTPTSGELIIHGNPVAFHSSKDSIKSGIGMVHQHFMLVPKLTVIENIIAGQETGTKFKLDKKLARQQIMDLSEQYGLKIDPDAPVGELSVAMQQRVEILKVLYRKAEILIFDEPTAVLTQQEIEEFCEILLKLKGQGKTILFISHKLREVLKVSDRATVIRLGKIIGTVHTSETTAEELTKMMVGRSINLGGGERKQVASKEELIKIEQVSYRKNGDVRKVDDLSLTVRAGEILGVAGVDGNGQEELVQMICGVHQVQEGNITIVGTSIKGKSIKQIKDLGLGYIPEDRHKDGLVLEFSISENVILGQHKESKFSKKKLLLKHGEIAKISDKLREAYDIRCGGIEAPASSLSGGNQQKIIIAREIFRNPKAILAVQPTRGLDVGAMEYIHNVLVEQRNAGKAVLLFSLELDEIMSLSDRIAVIYKGKIVGIVNARKTNREELGLMMLGQSQGKDV
jgi:general nucleoside transport system ATP-binding protein